MTYFAAVTSDEHHAPSSIHFDVSIPASDYSLLLNNIRGGLMPSLLTVDLRHSIYDKGSPVDYDDDQTARDALAQRQKQARRCRMLHNRLPIDRR